MHTMLGQPYFDEMLIGMTSNKHVLRRMAHQVKAVLIDLSGTIHVESNEIPGSIKALVRLKNSGLKYMFVTNTTKESQNVLHSRLTSMGFEIDKKQIYTSLIAARDYIQQQKLRPMLMLEDAALEDFEPIVNLEGEGEAVVVGLAPSKFNYETMNLAFRKLISGARLVAIHQGRYYKTSQSLSLGPGPFVKALAYAADIESEKVVTVGKPEKNFFTRALHSLDSSLLPEEVVMIGDDVRDDVAGAQSLGMKGILVRTGKYRTGDEQKIEPCPFLVVDSFSEAIDAILAGVATSN